jgi:hypothetical protein
VSAREVRSPRLRGFPLPPKSSHRFAVFAVFAEMLLGNPDQSIGARSVGGNSANCANTASGLNHQGQSNSLSHSNLVYFPRQYARHAAGPSSRSAAAHAKRTAEAPWETALAACEGRRRLQGAPPRPCGGAARGEGEGRWRDANGDWHFAQSGHRRKMMAVARRDRDDGRRRAASEFGSGQRVPRPCGSPWKTDYGGRKHGGDACRAGLPPERPL